MVFVLVQLTGDPMAMMVPGDMGAEDMARMREAFGLDGPLFVRYVRFISRSVVGDFGISFRYRLPAMGLVIERLPATLELGLTALVIGIASGVFLGVAAATRHNTWLDNVTMVFALVGQATPHFWLGIMAMLVFSVKLNLLPTHGRGGIEHLVLPALALSMGAMARFARLTRSSMLEVLSQDYVRTARSFGFSERIVVYRYALRNALISPLTFVGLEAGHLLGGAVVVETVFSWPGMGRLAIQSILARDYPVVLATVFLVALAYVIANLAVDVLYSAVDPRLSVSSGKE